MLKSQLLDNISKKYSNLSEAEIKRAINTIITKLALTLEKNQRIEIRGFGTLSTRERKSTVARNPKTNEKVTLTNKSTVHFKYGKELFELINGKKN